MAKTKTKENCTVLEAISTEEFATRFNVTRKTVDEWRKEGMPYLRIRGVSRDAVAFDFEKARKWVWAFKPGRYDDVK